MRVLIFLLVIGFVACRSSVTTGEKMFVIPSYGVDQPNPLKDTMPRKAGDIEVFRILAGDTTYFTRIYRIQDSEVRRYEATIMDNVLYSKVAYHWVNDSTVAFHLVDVINNKSYRFQLMGSGSTTTLIED